MDAEGRVKYQKRVPTTETSLRRVFGKRKRSRVVLESGCQTAWAVRLLQSMGHEVVVVNPRRVRLIADSTLKTDRIDAEILSWLSRQDEALLRPVYQRSEGAQDQEKVPANLKPLIQRHLCHTASHRPPSPKRCQKVPANLKSLIQWHLRDTACHRPPSLRHFLPSACPLPPFQAVARAQPTSCRPFSAALTSLFPSQQPPRTHRRPAPTHLQLSALEADS